MLGYHWMKKALPLGLTLKMFINKKNSKNTGTIGPKTTQT